MIPKIKKIKVADIDWCVEAEDIIDYYEIETDDIDKTDFTAKIDEVKSKLPTTVEIPVDSSSLTTIAYKIDDIADYLSDMYGWLVNGFNYTLIDADGVERRLTIE